MCSIQALTHTFEEKDHEISSMVILLLLLIQEGLLSLISESMTFFVHTGLQLSR